MVYLPEGIWYDYWTGERFLGKQYILRDAPLDVCPIYVKGGSMIPMYDEVDYVGQRPYDTLYLLATPEAGAYVHFQDDGEDYAYREGSYNLYAFSKDENGSLNTELLHEDYPRYRQIVLRNLGQ
jgi:alpha-glucosidase